MKSEYKLILMFITFSLFYTNCGPAGFQTNYNTIYSFSPIPGVLGGNVVPLTVGCGYDNMLCAKVKVCTPVANSATCDTLTVLLDTGSTGLRVFGSKIPTSLAGLTAKTDPITTYPLYSCAVYGDANYHWGSVKLASVTLGDVANVYATPGLTETAVIMPIQVIDYTVGDSGAGCRNAAGMTVTADVATANYHGILGIKFFKQDCGAYCLTNVIGANPSYYACTGTNCGTVTVALADQILNPIAALAGDNNGYHINLPSVGAVGKLLDTGVTATGWKFGSLVLGIGTQSNNIAEPSVTRLLADSVHGNIKINFNGVTTGAIIDSGSSANFFQYSGFPSCTLTWMISGGYFCPTTDKSFYPTLYGSTGTRSVITSFTVGNADILIPATSVGVSTHTYNAFENIAATLPAGPAANFYFGLPFFLGHKLYYGMESSGTPLGDGPFIGL